MSMIKTATSLLAADSSAWRVGVGDIDLGGQGDNAILADAPELVVFHGHGYRDSGGWRRSMSRAMSSRAGSLPTRAAITAAQAASGGSAVTAWHSRSRPSSIGWPRRSISPSV